MRVVVADDVAGLGLARCCRMPAEAVGEAADADELLRMVALDQPDVAIVDIRMPPTHTDEGLVAARRIRQRYPPPRSSCSASTWAPYAQRPADQPGSLGYLLKELALMSPCWSMPCAGSPRASAWSTPRSWPDSARNRLLALTLLTPRGTSWR